MSRNFNSENAYKLTKRIVLTIAVSAFIYSLLMFNASWDYIRGIEWSRTYNRICEPLPPSVRADCLYNVQDMFETRFERAWQSLLVALALPSVFFIITRTFNYLFPKKVDTSKKGAKL